MADFHTFPAHVAKPLGNAGEWTASLTGRPHHNVALDEAHEMVINRRLKQITSRASHFRTVELADFVAFLEKVQGAWDKFLTRLKKDSGPSKPVHKERASKHKGTTPVLPHISDENAMPGSRDFTALLTSADFKACLIRYISQKFVKKARLSPNLTLVLDSPAYDTTIMVQHGDVSNLPPNEHGEADYAVWHHAIHCSAPNVLIVSSDSDTWVYGLGISERGWLAGKTVFVQHGTATCSRYVHITLGVRLVSDHPQLAHLKYPVASMVALYVLTGCDYVSKFCRISKESFLFGSSITWTICVAMEMSWSSYISEVLTMSLIVCVWTCGLKLVCAMYLSMSKDNMQLLGGNQ